MLIQCPRCGFNQPKDRYCAKCGVDIEVYRPNPDPFLKRLMTNPATILVITFVAVGSLTFYVQTTRKKNQKLRASVIQNRERTNNSKNLVNINEASISNSQNDKSNLNITNENTPSEGSQIVANNSNESNMAQSSESLGSNQATPISTTSTNESTNAQINSSSSNIKASERDPKKINVRFKIFEATEQQMNLFRRSNSITDDGELFWAQIKMSDIGRRFGTPRLLAESQRQNIGESSQERVFFGGRDPETQQNLGITIQAQFTEIEDNGLKGEVEIIRELYESNETNSGIARRSFTLQIENLHSDSSLVIGGFWAGVPIGLDRPWFASSFLKLFNSADYQAGKSEVILLLENTVNSR